MSKEMTVIALGIWVMVVPYLGIPGSWRTVFLVVTGACIAVVGFLLRGEALSQGSVHSKHNSFVESSIPHSSQESHDHKEGITSLN